MKDKILHILRFLGGLMFMVFTVVGVLTGNSTLALVGISPLIFSLMAIVVISLWEVTA